jgi:hypothetical protein
MGVPANESYRENRGTGERELRANLQEWGWASSSRCIAVAVNFFLPAETAIRRSTPHDLQTIDLETTRGGALLHELSHYYAGTADEILPAAAIVHLGRLPENNPNRKAYSPKSCWALAKTDPEKAANNADSYRSFCEDAKALWVL